MNNCYFRAVVLDEIVSILCCLDCIVLRSNDVIITLSVNKKERLREMGSSLQLVSS